MDQMDGSIGVSLAPSSDQTRHTTILRVFFGRMFATTRTLSD
jgi:hypothetical protein